MTQRGKDQELMVYSAVARKAWSKVGDLMWGLRNHDELVQGTDEEGGEDMDGPDWFSSNKDGTKVLASITQP